VKIRFNRREKTILRLMAAVVALAIFSKVWAVYQEERIELETRIEGLREQITSMDQKLRGESPQAYLDQAADIEEDLGDVRDSVLVLPDETGASLLVRQTISDKAEAAGIKINSISSRRSKEIEGAEDIKELRVYFGYDAELGPLLKFFRSIEEEEYFMVIDTLNISVRRRIRNIRNNRNRNLKQRSSLNGNAVIAIIFRADPNAPLDRYSKPDRVVRDDAEEVPEVSDLEDDVSVEKGAGEGTPDALATETIDDPIDEDFEEEPMVDEDDETPAEDAPPPPALQPKPKPLTATAQPLKKEDKPIKERF